MKAKTIFMAALTLLAIAITTTGIPSNSIAWLTLGISFAISMLGWAVQSNLIKTTSVAGQLNWIDFIKGLLVAVSNVIGSFSAAHLVGTPVDWNAIWTATGSIFIGYMIKQFASLAIPQIK